jgi:hypothetical protein
VELGGRDPDLGAEAELEAIGEAGRRVHQHVDRAHLAQEAQRAACRFSVTMVSVWSEP